VAVPATMAAPTARTLPCTVTARSRTRQGAENRASGARDKFPGYDLYVGMEGGLEQVRRGA